ncbi:hypothetical protein [Calothrix sp. 336/3]|uniref:hypothetical protein n=1 Tax=Calothrix sp. 336/3 TaxID=1337936 RepID=UPI0005505E76|nr:hypothetical protein [Calothrix sp. 336/3]AKG22678.1 hypothetical protein IJ00_16615 [Calothrix sp. 336/3]
MFYIQLAPREWRKPKKNSASPVSQAETRKEKTIEFAHKQAVENIRKTQQVHYLERRLFF